MKLITSREYKVVLQHDAFVERRHALQSLSQQLQQLTTELDVHIAGEFESPKQREVTFFDTQDRLLRRSSLLLRRRIDQERRDVRFTLKCRNQDRYIAAGFDVSAAAGFDYKAKFEEDIVLPFSSRFSSSGTVKFEQDEIADSPFGLTPRPAGDLADLFPGLAGLFQRHEATASEVVVVNGIHAFEEVHGGLVIKLAKAAKVELQAVVWCNHPAGTPILAELSFQFQDDNENFSADAARAAKRFFESLDRLDIHKPSGKTKTQFVYGD